MICSLKSVALMLILQQRLFLGINKIKKSLPLEQCSLDNTLYRLKHSNGLIYRWNIALRMEKQSDLPPMDLALSLSSLLSSNILSPDKDSQGTIQFTVTVTEPGWLDFYLGDCFLAIWLDYLTLALQGSTTATSQPLQKRKNFNPFPLQYAHGRCCSLLRSATEQGLIKLKSDHCSPSRWQWLEPTPTPWLDNNKQWQLVENQDKNLLYQLIDTTDLLFRNSSENWYQITKNLSQAFLEVEAQSRIFGEVQRKTPLLAQGRLGLIWLTQILLYRLLTEKLGISVFKEL